MKSPGLVFPKRQMPATTRDQQAELEPRGCSGLKTKEGRTTLGGGSIHKSCAGPSPTSAALGQGRREGGEGLPEHCLGSLWGGPQY